MSFCQFDTQIGPCGIAWNDRGVRGVQLPEASADATRARLIRRWGANAEAAPPFDITKVIDAITALMGGAPEDLTFAVLDMHGLEPFACQVYEEARRIPPGETRTYGQIAVALGEKGLSRKVGQALGRNPFAIIVPCHRVLAADGKTGGFSAGGGVATKLRMLSIERARTDPAPGLFDDLPLMARPKA